MIKVNPSGLTLEEWALAAGFVIPAHRCRPASFFLPSRARKAWAEDEDCSDWMVLHQTIRRLKEEAQEAGYAAHEALDGKLSAVDDRVSLHLLMKRVRAPWGRKDAHYRERNTSWRTGVTEAWSDRRRDREIISSIMES